MDLVIFIDKMETIMKDYLKTHSSLVKENLHKKMEINMWVNG
jgi:hypothetical protein